MIPGAEIDPAPIGRSRSPTATPGLLFASATWHFSTETAAARRRAATSSRSPAATSSASRSGEETVLRPLASDEANVAVAPGDEIEVRLSLRSRAAAEYVHLRDPRPAGFEPAGDRAALSGSHRELGLSFYQETRDSATNFFFERLPAG